MSESGTPRIVVFGAAGFTGALVAQAMVERGLSPVLAGRRRSAIEEIADRLGGLETEFADADRPESVRRLVDRGDVLVSTVGPFGRCGAPAVTAAVEAGAIYLDASGEPAFVRRVFEVYGPRAQDSGAALLPAIAFESAPGNLAGAWALERAGGTATRLDIGYFMPGDLRAWQSGGSRASFLGGAIEPSFAWRRGIRSERPAARVRAFHVEGRRTLAVSAGTTEHFSLPRLYPQLLEVNSYLGYLPAPARLMQALSLAGAPLLRSRAVRRLLHALLDRAARGSSGGPDAQTRRRTRSEVIAVAHDEHGGELASVRVAGAVNGYDFTARILAWAAEQASRGAIACRGAVGPVEAFGLAALERGCAEAGMHRGESRGGAT